MTCPHCHAPATLDHFRGNPECVKAVASLNAISVRARRISVTRAGGAFLPASDVLLRPCLCACGIGGLFALGPVVSVLLS